MAVAEPTVSKCVSAVTATSATGVCNGPTHCCWATRPVTLRSTLSTHKKKQLRASYTLRLNVYTTALDHLGLQY